MKKIFFLLLSIISISFANYEYEKIGEMASKGVKTSSLAKGMPEIPAELTKEQAQELGMTKVKEGISISKDINVEAPPFYLEPSHLDIAKVVVVVDKSVRTSNNPKGQTITAYVDGIEYFKFDTSTGTEEMKATTDGEEYLATTPTGIFRISSAYTQYQSQAFLGAGMPYAMFFHGGIAIHGTSESNYRILGRRASGGCARMRINDVRLLSALIRSTGEGHDNYNDESLVIRHPETKRPVKLSRHKLLDRIRIHAMDRETGEDTGVHPRPWSYDAAIVVVDGQ